MSWTLNLGIMRLAPRPSMAMEKPKWSIISTQTISSYTVHKEDVNASSNAMIPGKLGRA